MCCCRLAQLISIFISVWLTAAGIIHLVSNNAVDIVDISSTHLVDVDTDRGFIYASKISIAVAICQYIGNL